MKQNNNLIKVTNTETGECKYFTGDAYVMIYIGCSQGAMPQIKSGKSAKFAKWKYEIVDASEIKWKDINNI